MEWDLNGDLPQELSFGFKNLDSGIARVGHVDLVLRIDSNAVRSAELPRLVSRFSPRLNPGAVFVDLGDARIDIAVADVGVTGPVPCHVGYLAEHSVYRRQGRVRVRERPGFLVRGFLLAPEDHGYAALGIKFDDHV